MTEHRDKHAFLCIGGPYDGRRYATDELGFRVSRVPMTPWVTWHANEYLPMITAEVVHTHYVADRLRAGKNTEVWFWRPSEQTMEQTIKLMLERYERANNIIWDIAPARLT